MVLPGIFSTIQGLHMPLQIYYINTSLVKSCDYARLDITYVLVISQCQYDILVIESRQS